MRSENVAFLRKKKKTDFGKEAEQSEGRGRDEKAPLWVLSSRFSLFISLFGALKPI